MRLLCGRRGRPTRLHLNDGRQITAWNCAWGRDHGREWEHLTLNMSPRRADAETAFVSTADVMAASDVESGADLYARGSETTKRRGTNPGVSIVSAPADQPRDWIGT